MLLETSRASKRGLRCSSLRLRPLSKVSGPWLGGVDADRTVQLYPSASGAQAAAGSLFPRVHPPTGGGLLMKTRGCVAPWAPGPRSALDGLPSSKEVRLGMTKILYVGIDVASRSNTAQWVDPTGHAIGKPWTFPNTLPGAQALEARLAEVLQQGAYAHVKIGLEATAFYDWHLADYLAASTVLRPWQPAVSRLNALRVARFRTAADEPDKTDRVDAAVIADFLRVGRNLPAPHVSGDPYLPLKRLTRYRFHLVGTLVRETNHFLTHLFLQCSGLAQAPPLGRPLGATGCALIEDFPSAEALAALPLEELMAFLIQQGKNRFPDPAQMAQRVQQAARESYRLRPALARSEHFILANLIRTIRALKASLKEINKAIGEELAAFPNTLTTLPGVGPVLAAGILAELGDIRRFARDDQVAKLAGLVWKRHQSGQFEAQEPSDGCLGQQVPALLPGRSGQRIADARCVVSRLLCGQIPGGPETPT